MITIDNVIGYFLDLKHTLNEEIEDIIYTDLKHSLTFKQLQNIDHKRQEINTIYKILEFLDKERGNLK